MSYLYYMAHNLIKTEPRDRVYIFDSYLFHELERAATVSSIDTYSKARNFSKREPHLFDKDFWVFPICKG